MSVGLQFATTLQDIRRLSAGIGYGGTLEEVIPCIPFFTVPDAGESLTVAIEVEGLGNFSGFIAVGDPPIQGTPAPTFHTFTFRRLTSLSADDVTLLQANNQPNLLGRELVRLRRISILRALGVSLVKGTDTDANGFLGWENMNFPLRTDVAAGAATSAGVMQQLLLMDDACTSGALGDRASAFVTTALGRRNIERAAQLEGLS